MKGQSSSNSIKMKHVTINVVFDNNPYKNGLTPAWGFSCLVMVPEQTILFDTGGNGSILLANMEKLGIKPRDVDRVVLSHIHGDHVGGLLSFLERNPAVTVYALESFPQGFKEDIKRYGAELVEVHGPLQIGEHVYSTGELAAGIKEQSLIIHTDRGLIVITGCAHPGIVTVIRAAQVLIPDDLSFVMGGFHLAGDTTDRIEDIVFTFMRLGVRSVGPCHCSGDTARELFEAVYKNKFINLGVGKEITAEDLEVE